MKFMKNQRGFTLIELMIVVAIIGILAAIAIPAFLEYMNKGKKSEANLQLRSIETKVKSYRIANGRLPAAAGAMPFTIPVNCVYPRGSQAYWETQLGWKEMGFHVDEDSRYQYAWVPAGNSGTHGGTAFAMGDLDCDGTMSQQRLLLTVSEGNLSATYVDPTPD